MTDMKLRVIRDFGEMTPIPALSDSDFPEGIAGTLEDFHGQALVPEEHGALLLLTVDPAHAQKALQDETGRVFVVYIGSSAQLGADLDRVEACWSPSESGEALRTYYKKLLGCLRKRFEADFYRQALLTTIDTVPDMLWYKRLDGIHTMVNEAFTGVVHKTREDICGKDHFYIWDAPRPAEGNEFACAESEEIAIRTGKTYICDEPVKTREGMKQLTTYKTPVYDPYGNVFGTVGVGHDVTNFSNLGIELSILVEHMPFPMTIFTPDWKVVRMNTHYMDIVGAQDAESFDYLTWKKTVPVPVSERTESVQQHSATRECLIEVDGEQKSFILTELEIRDFFDNVSGYFCTMEDITYRRAYEKSIIRAANTDVLTGMYNRRYIYRLLSEKSDRPFHFLYIDIDKFKAINDKFGHGVGDEVLIKTSELIAKCFPDVVTARLGGDEFAVVDDCNTREEIERRCAVLRAEIENAFAKYHCGTMASIGIAYTDGVSTDTDELIRQSDIRMYEEKKLHHGA